MVRISLLLVFASFVPAAFAQSFEAASVKELPESVGYPPRAGYWMEPRMEGPERFRARGALASLIEWAYRLRDFQVLGGPAWIREPRVRFEVQATAGRSVDGTEIHRMVQAMLAERFQLKFHRDVKEVSVLALLAGKNGPKLKASADPELNEGSGTTHIGGGEFIGRNVRIETLVRILTDNADRPVVDQTALTGRYDFNLHYDQASLVDWRLSPALPGMLQDLGLRLEPKKVSMEMLVIDSVERPSEN